MHRLLQILPAVVAAGLLALLITGSEAAEEKAPPPDNPGHENYVETIKFDDDFTHDFEMVAVPGGTFMMGSPEGEPGRRDDEGPRHPVHVRPFWMGKCEVTWDEYDFYRYSEPELDPSVIDPPPLKGADAVSRPTPPYVPEDYGHGHEAHPAICMTHHAAMKYCEWLSESTGKVYRLPTEAEWEYACRAGSDTAYCCDDPAELGEYAWYNANSADEEHPKGTTHEVGTKQPNAFGLHDMHGNVMEWVMDHYDPAYYKRFDPKEPALWPVLLPTKYKWSHVARGGHWKDGPEELRSSARRYSKKVWMKHDPQSPQSIWWLTKYDTIGFRVVRAYEEQENLVGLKSKVTKFDSEPEEEFSYLKEDK